VDVEAADVAGAVELVDRRRARGVGRVAGSHARFELEVDEVADLGDSPERALPVARRCPGGEKGDVGGPVVGVLERPDPVEVVSAAKRLAASRATSITAGVEPSL
jgi:hypothetical protein